MSPVKRVVAVLAVAAIAATPAVARADTASDAATAQFNALGLATLTGMPSGRTTYRTYDQIVADMQSLADANSTLVQIRTAPYKTTEGRDVKYLEITNNVTAKDGKPVFFNMGAIHGNETPAAEDSLEFAYDVINTSKTNTKVKALLDKVRLIDMPVVNPDGLAHNRRYSCGGVVAPVAPSTCSTVGTDLNRSYPFGWGSDVGVNHNQRGTGPGSEPEVKNTMDIVQNHQVVDLLTSHTNERAIFYPSLDIFAGQTPDLNNGYRDFALAMAHATADGYTNVRDSAHDYETSGETIDWSYYATRGFANTIELVGAVRGCPQALPDYLNCTTADFTGTPGPTSTAAMTTVFQGHAARNAFWISLIYATLPGAHAQITGTATPGATLKVTKDETLYTAPIKQDNGTFAPPQALPTHLESSMVVPANGAFTMDVNPSVRPVPAFEADGEHAGPRGYYRESYTITCTAADGTLLSSSKVLVDKGDVANVSLCTPASVGGSVPATLSLTMGTPASFGPFTAGVAKDYLASTTASIISSAGDATLTVADPSTTATGHLVNGTFSLPSALLAGGSPLPAVVKTYSAPVSNDVATIAFTQHVGANDALRTGTYAKTLTFTLSTTNP